MKIRKMTEVSKYGERTSLYTGIDKVKTILFPNLQSVLTDHVGGSAYIIPLKDVFYLVEIQDWEKVKKGWAIPKRLFKESVSVDKNLNVFYLDVESLPTIDYNFCCYKYIADKEYIDSQPSYQLIEYADIVTHYNIDTVKEYFKFFKISSKKFDYSYHPNAEHYQICGELSEKVAEHIQKHAVWLDFGEILLPEINKSLLVRSNRSLLLPFELKHPRKKIILKTPGDRLKHISYNTPFPPKREIIEYTKFHFPIEGKIEEV